MHEPETYESSNHGVAFAAETALKKLGDSIRWRPDCSDTILDLGCGTGNVLVDVILPVFKGKYSTCFGTDISQTMIEFAAEKYADRKEEVRFLTMDITKVEEFLTVYGRVDHVISSFAIHWIRTLDLDAGLRGIFELLNPGGDFFTDHVCTSFLFDVYETVGQDLRWGEYFDKIEQFTPTSHRSEDPAEDLRKQLTRVGFVDVVVHIIPIQFRFANVEGVRKLLKSVAVQISNIPDQEVEEYVDYLFEFGVRMGGLTETANGYLHHLKAFVAYARKPDM